MSFSIVAGGITALATLLGWSIVKDGIRAGVKMYSGPFSAIPKLIAWGFEAYKGVTNLPKRLVVMLSKRVGGRLLVRSAYVIVRGAAKGVGWGIVKIAKGAACIGSCLFTSLTKGTGSHTTEDKMERYSRVICDLGGRTTPRVTGRGLRDVEIIENYYEEQEKKVEERPRNDDAIGAGIKAGFLSEEEEEERFLVVNMDENRDELEQIREFEQAIGEYSWNMYTMTPEEAQAQASSDTSGLSYFMEQHNSFSTIRNNDDDDDDDDDDNGDKDSKDGIYKRDRWNNGEVSSQIFL